MTAQKNLGRTLSRKIIESHLQKGELRVGGDICIRVDQVLTQDATGTIAYLEFEAI
ncbi:unnamed protein product, partial [marine sediment metagenome]